MSGKIEKYSAFNVTGIGFKQAGVPEVVNLSSALVPNVTQQKMSNVDFAAKLTDDEKYELMFLLNKIALRAEAELKDILEDNLTK